MEANETRRSLQTSPRRCVTWLSHDAGTQRQELSAGCRCATCEGRRSHTVSIHHTFIGFPGLELQLRC